VKKEKKKKEQSTNTLSKKERVTKDKNIMLCKNKNAYL
jgi:hypothetical protein